MAVNKAPVRQQSYLTEYDRQMAEYLRRMGGSIGAQDIAAEAYGGKFPVGTMTAKILSGVLAGASDKRAMNREEQAKKAARALLSGRATDIQPQLYEDGQFEAGEYMTPEGQFVTQLAPVEEGVAQDANRAAYEARILREQARPEEIAQRNAQIAQRNREIGEEKALFNQFVSDQPNKVSYSNTRAGNGYSGTPKDPLSAVLSGNYRGEDIQPLEPLLPIQNQAIERKELYKAETIPGITIEGSKKDPDWWDRNILGAVPDATVRDKIELVQLAGYDPLEWSLFEQQLNEKEGKEYKFQNVSDVLLTNGTNTFETKTATRTTLSGEAEQVYWQPSTGTWQPIRNSGFKMATKDGIGEEGKTLNRKIGFVKQWLRARNLNENEEFIKNMAEGFTGDTFRIDNLTGQSIDELEVVYNNLKNIGNIDLISINNDEKLNNLRNKKPEQAARIDKNIQSLNDDIIKSDISRVFNLVKEVRSLIPEKGNIPGIGQLAGGLGNINTKLLTPEGRKLRDTLARLMNTELRLVSGAAVTDSEFERYKQQMPVGFMKTEEQFRDAIFLLERGLNNDLKTIFASYPQNIQSIYKNRDGALKPLQDDEDRLKQKWNIN
jgi:hypothetical protein